MSSGMLGRKYMMFICARMSTGRISVSTYVDQLMIRSMQQSWDWHAESGRTPRSLRIECVHAAMSISTVSTA